MYKVLNYYYIKGKENNGFSAQSYKDIQKVWLFLPLKKIATIW